MTAESILEVLWAQGFTVSLVDNDHLAISPASTLKDTQRELLRANKAEIISLLLDAKATADPNAWRELATAYNHHHFKCSTCIAAGRSSRYGLRCGVGAALWNSYQNT